MEIVGIDTRDDGYDGPYAVVAIGLTVTELRELANEVKGKLDAGHVTVGEARLLIERFDVLYEAIKQGEAAASTARAMKGGTGG